MFPFVSSPRAIFLTTEVSLATLPCDYRELLIILIYLLLYFFLIFSQICQWVFSHLKLLIVENTNDIFF